MQVRCQKQVSDPELKIDKVEVKDQNPESRAPRTTHRAQGIEHDHQKEKRSDKGKT